MKPVLLYGLLAALFLSFGSCKNTDDEFLPDDVLPPVPEGYVRMQITVPGLTPVSTYALSPVDETAVSTVGVLVFGSDSKYLCYAAVTEPAKITGTGSTKTFDVDLRDANNASIAYVMVVANASVDTTGFAASRPTKETIMGEKMTFPSSGKWNVAKTNDTDFTPFPMWGMTASPVSLAGTSSIPSISLLRSVAKIDVGVGLDASDVPHAMSPTFVIESVTLYNSLAKGLIAPGSSATSPNLPDPVANNSEFSYVHGADFTDNLSCTNTIYMAEQEAEPVTGRPYLIVKGNYNSEGSSYYRIDFVDSGGAPQPVLRNHRYKFNITTVKGKGYTDLADAIAATPFNITTTLTATDAANETLTSYVYDGQYALGVSKDEYILDKASTTNAYKKNNNLKVSATYANYTISVAQTGSWLTMSASATGTIVNTVTDHTFSVTENSGSSDRTATITVTSGRLKKNITVTQKGVAFSVTGFLALYPASGSVTTFPKVKSPWPWRVNVKSDPDAIIRSFTASGTGTGSDETFTFTLKNNTSAYSGLKSVAILEFFSPTGEFTPYEQTIELPGGASTYTPTKHNGWAGSNIWNGSKLTFDDTPTSNPTGDATGHEGYQGVFFKWGSLIGIDPMRGDAGITWTNGTGNTNKVYVPSYNSATPTSSTWQSITAGTSSTYYTWGNIRYADNTIVGDENLPARARLYEITTPANIANHRGDICRYLTETGAAPGAASGTKWRMPVADEFSGATADYPIKPSSKTNWPNNTGSFAGDAAGTWTVVDGGVVVGRRKTNEPAGAYQPFFPAAGYRYPSGVLYGVGLEGDYWTSSPYSSLRAHSLYFPSGDVHPDGNADRTIVFTVRCVKEW